MKFIRQILKILCAFLIGYAVIFSLIVTVVMSVLAYKILTPYFEVKRLQSHNPQQTRYMQQYRSALSSKGKPDSILQIFIPLDSISPTLVKAVLAAEDDGFYTHPGFDIIAITKAVEHNRSHKSFQRGASTITQQVAKNLFAGTEKSYERKFKEMAYSLLMEWLLGKDRILELYLNYAQWGPNAFGCEAAARTYYKKSCKSLSVQQSAHLAAILASPVRLNPHATQSIFLQKRLAVIANNMYRRRAIDTTMWVELGGDDSNLVARDTADAPKDETENEP